jgi:hypothetical protein
MATANGVTARPSPALPRQTQLPANVQNQFVNQLMNTSRLSIAPIWHAIEIDTLALRQQVDFFTTVPGGQLSWWEANFRKNYINEPMTIYGMRMYFVGNGTGIATNVNVGANFRVATGPEKTTADLLNGLWNIINDGLIAIKVNQTEHPFLSASKLLAPIKWAEYGYDDGVGNAAYSSILGFDSLVSYYVFRTPKKDIDPFIIGANDLFSVRLSLPIALPAAGQIPDDWYLKFELLSKVSTSMYAG